ncbi:unnamed protein product (macronuclear) [Paramecium tetraurelia]|uniref:Uncharacterized protein n=2 Tax=Paramecium TaxID=5884 RepID=A0CJ05_PARTE|nr:uncharacterized protein GSPATT00007907001 [Paramecium tetraurelia]CAD8146745.1 unnamed protein product [Paramecium octaurelia]CAK70772.1 unnamed protein product [Paramecium tetraurelia]|eukprot:XP_001438169.1 hypothetical protein (macronuclear) [Paramecium tetraurelia strain d4-2]
MLKRDKKQKVDKIVQTNMEEDPRQFYLIDTQEEVSGHILERLRQQPIVQMKKVAFDKEHGNTIDSVPINIKSHVKSENELYFELQYQNPNLLPSYYPFYFLRERFPKLLIEYYKNNSVLILK